MEENELTLEQMKELESIGIDTSSASLYKVVIDGGVETHTILAKNKNDDAGLLNPDLYQYAEFYPLFNLDDLLNIIPEKIVIDGVHTARLILGKTMICYEYYDMYNDNEDYVFNAKWGNNSLIQCAFELVKWLKNNKFI